MDVTSFQGKIETTTQTYVPAPAATSPKGLPPAGLDFIRQGHPLVRLAGLSGAAAVALGAYGAHGNRCLLS